jgi:hypothetical protein
MEIVLRLTREGPDPNSLMMMPLVLLSPHLVSEPVHLAAGVHKDDTLGNGQGLVQLTQSIQLLLFLLHIVIELLDTRLAGLRVSQEPQEVC